MGINIKVILLRLGNEKKNQKRENVTVSFSVSPLPFDL